MIPDYGSWPVAVFLVKVGLVLVAAMLAAVMFERTVAALGVYRERRLSRKYGGLLQRALDGDDEALRTMVASPSRHRIPKLLLLITPLIGNRDPARIARARAIAEALSLVPLADRQVNSIWWWRRARALRALGLVQLRDRTARIVAALDDGHPDVRAAAMDALTDLKDPRSLQAIVVRLHDTSLHRGRRAAALAAFGRQCEPFLLELAAVDAGRRTSYARALSICGSEQSRPVLCEWAAAADDQLRAAALEALGHVGLDDRAAGLAMDALDAADPSVRAMAARALRGWAGSTDAITALVRHLDDVWMVAVQAAESLQSLGPRGLAALKVTAERTDLPGILARQMLWEEERA